MEYWSIWYPKAAATGLLLARGLLDATDTLLLHAPGEVVTVEVHDERGNRLAYGKDLERTGAESTPICRLRREGQAITREDFWPDEADYGLPVMLPGGEVGILKSWWNADDRKEWRWQIELYNSTRE
jgi:hypothetical protein